MSDSILSRSKLLVYFDIDSSLDKKVNQLYKPQVLPLCLYHFHYSSLYFPEIFQHFKVYFPEKATHNNVRFKYKGRQLPIDLPIGLFVDHFSQIKVSYSELQCPQAFKLMMISWKKGYTIVNKQGGCDHIYKKLNLQSQKQLFTLHKNGMSHNLNKIQKYEGNVIALKLIIDETVIQRKCQKVKQSLKEYICQEFDSHIFDQNRVKIYSHNIQIDLGITLKELLQEWNYNDGYCYIKIVYQ